MLRPGAAEQRRTRGDVAVGASSSEGRPDPAEKPRGEGGFVVRRQMKQVVGDLVTVLGELRTVVGDIRTLVSQIDVVTHKIDQSVSSDQSDRSAASSSANVRSANVRSTTATTTTTSTSGYPSSYKGDDDDGDDDEYGHRRRDGAAAVPSSDSKSAANVCDLLCFGGQQTRDKLVGQRPAGFGSAPGVCYLADRQGERLSNHDRVYVAYRPRFSRHSIDRRPPGGAKRATSPLRTTGDRTDGKENLPGQKPAPSARSNAYITHIYENIKAFARKTSPVAPSAGPESQTKAIPSKPCRCLCSAPASSVISPKTAPSRWNQANRDTPHVLKPHNNNNNVSPGSGHRTKAKVQHEYSGLYEREMEEKLELEFDESLDLLDTLADVQTVDNDFEPVCDDPELLTPVRDPCPIDLIRKHADVVAWAQSAWPETRYPDPRYPGSSVGCSEDDDDDRETDSEWYDQAAVPRRTLNCQHFVNFSWRPVIEP